MRYVANLGPSGFDKEAMTREGVYSVSVGPEYVVSENFYPENVSYTVDSISVGM